MENTAQKEMTRRVVALLNKDEIEFLNQLSVDSFFSTGHRLTKVDIVSALVDATMQLGITCLGVKDKVALTKKIVTAALTSAEKRGYPRVRKSLTIKFRPLETMQEFKDSTTDNISVGGISFDIPAQHAPRINQMLEIIISDPEGGSVKTIGRVAWVNTLDTKEKIKIGIKVTYVEKNDFEKFKEYLDG